MVQRLLLAALATLVLASVADACFLKKRMRSHVCCNRVAQEIVFVDADNVQMVGNQLTITSIDNIPVPPTNMLNGLPFKQPTQVVVYGNFNAAATDDIEIQLTPVIVSGDEKGRWKRYKHCKVAPHHRHSEVALNGGYDLFYLIPQGDLAANSKYSLVAIDLSGNAPPSNTVTFTTN